MNNLISICQQMKELNATELKKLIDLAWDLKFHRDKEELEALKKAIEESN